MTGNYMIAEQAIQICFPMTSETTLRFEEVSEKKRHNIFCGIDYPSN